MLNRYTVSKIISLLKLVFVIAGQNTQNNQSETTPLPENIPLVLNTTGCKIYDFDIEYARLPIIWGYVCGKRFVEIYKSNDNVIKFKMLKHFDACCYRSSSYSGMENTDGFEPCLTFTDGMEVALTSDFVSIGCNTKGEPYYTDRFAFVRRQNIKSLVNRQAYSVLMVVIDSVSRYRAFRQLPDTVDYLLENNWLDYKGYHKVARNTYPNIHAVMMGRTRLPDDCKSEVQCKHLLMFTKYKEAGYITALGEDAAKHATFYFNETLTDHYLTPFIRTSELKSKRDHSKCSSKIQSGAQVLSYALDFARTYRYRRSFGYFYISSFSHDPDFNLESVDKAFKNFFEELKHSGVLDRTFVFFFSDHGINFGNSNQELFPENRLPMLFMWVPQKFTLQHPKLSNNMIINQDRLTTHYNIHRTLYEIMKLTNKTVVPYKSYGCKKITSLFLVIPETENCLTAGIDVEYCACNAVTIKKTSEDANASLKEALKYIEKVAVETATLPCTMCERYQFDTLYKVRSFPYGNDRKVTIFVLTIKMQPNDTVFEVIVTKTVSRIWPNKNTTVSITKHDYKTTNLTSISETSKDIDWCALYRRDQSFCICMWDRTDCDKASLYELTQDLVV